jgi:nucleoside 2-deoxyribosyltransferase
MIVHLITSKKNLDQTIPYLRRIVTAIHNKESTLARDWIEPALVRYSKESKEGAKRPPVNWKAVQKDNLEAIAKADVIIAEATETGFGIGYQVAYAVQQKKPVLILRNESANRDSFASGVDNVNVIYREYDEKTLEKYVEDFLDENDISTKDMRFNFFIDRPIYNYLRWSSLKTGKTKAEVLRELVQKEIDKSTDH